MCDHTMKEAKGLIKYCFQIQENIMDLNNSEPLSEITELIAFVDNFDNRITAMNFFEIDRKTLLGILNIITTYLIVILQLNLIEQ